MFKYQQIKLLIGDKMDGDITSMFEDKRKLIKEMAEGQMAIGENIGKMIYSIGCGARRAYIGVSDDGSIGNGDEGSEGTDGRLPLYKKIGEQSTE
jgi:hypothetical protein